MGFMNIIKNTFFPLALLLILTPHLYADQVSQASLATRLAAWTKSKLNGAKNAGVYAAQEVLSDVKGVTNAVVRNKGKAALGVLAALYIRRNMKRDLENAWALNDMGIYGLTMTVAGGPVVFTCVSGAISIWWDIILGVRARGLKRTAVLLAAYPFALAKPTYFG